ncbi:Hydantoinase B/oxoprolinase [Pleurostoma richardsiae]|uniref:Hydantoinase B/oxoprolinase n=1 Tax=Pleurostoma richardsiae TaxID=41990 RepID=A0AA38R8V0_9PEZI|nr:Hydantoinase B/oxoprolinase [Pleurostoma richardsiae]
MGEPTLKSLLTGPAVATTHPSEDDAKIKVYIDRGGTFTDCIGIVPGQADIVIKLLSVDPTNYNDAPTEGIRRILEIATAQAIPRGTQLDTSRIASIRMGTTVATNALLERKGERCALLITKGFGELLQIGHQTRPHLFDLDIKKADVLYSKSVEVDERVTIDVELAENKHIGTTVQGLSGDTVRILKPLNDREVTDALLELWNDGYRSIAVCLAHSYTFPRHELRIAELAREIGFTHISLSSQLTPMIRLVPRGMSATADAYLTPTVKRYIDGFSGAFKGTLENAETTRCQFMQSDGGLADFKRFSGLRAILSGPAGGVVGHAKTTFDPKDNIPVIGFDMGGTSTDVSRYAGKYEHVFETTTAGITIQSPQLDINTVAAGGGSILFWKNGLFTVGPESAGAHPGPACYRKGGPLTVTDANLFLGRLLPEYFPKIFGESEDQPLDTEIVAARFAELTKKVNADTGRDLTPEEVAVGFLNVANEGMCRPIRSLTEGRGYDARNHRLAVFGGAGGQHACAIARTLKIGTVVMHKYSSILSAYGMALAEVVHESLEPSSEVYSGESLPRLRERLDMLEKNVKLELFDQGFGEENLRYERYLNMRYQGTDTSLMILEPLNGDFEEAFLKQHLTEFSFTVPGRPILIDDLRVRGMALDGKIEEEKSLVDQITVARASIKSPGEPISSSMVYFTDTGRVQTPVYRLGRLKINSSVPGPAVILDATQTIVVLPGATATALERHVVIDVGIGAPKELSTDIVDPVQLSVFGHRFMGIAEQMGRTLQKTSVSLNIKERLDFSCAIFGPDGGLVANAPHVPVHLGSMQNAVRYQHEVNLGKLKSGDVLVTNHPDAGGTHLPDITVVTPVFGDDGKEIIFYTASRGHHRDIGGYKGLSGHPECTSLEQEGALITSFKLCSQGKFEEEGITKILVEDPAQYPDCIGSNSIHDNLTDLKAQIAANQRGSLLIQELFVEYGTRTVQRYMNAIQATAEIAVRQYLKKVAKVHPKPLKAVDFLDDGTEIHLEVRIDSQNGSTDFDFTGTGPETYGNRNAPKCLVYSAIIYALRAMINEDIPLNQGCLNPTNIIIPKNTVLSPSCGAAVYTGNSLTSQRVTDVVFKAFQACAASQGCMNSVQIYGGEKAKPGEPFQGFTFMYGETICGGSGAGPTWNGVSAVHTNMTNTRVSDLEILEKRYPILVKQFAIRHGSGGEGAHPGGDGSIRAFEARAATTFSLSSERRTHRPYGMNGGGPGKSGRNLALLHLPDGKNRWANVGGKGVVKLKCGEQLYVHTPGGGAWGAKESDLKDGFGKKLPQYWRGTGSLHAFAATQSEG